MTLDEERAQREKDGGNDEREREREITKENGGPVSAKSVPYELNGQYRLIVQNAAEISTL